MSDKKQTPSGLSLVDSRGPHERERERVERDVAATAVRSGLRDEALSPLDNEALLALALGEELLPCDEAEATEVADLQTSLEQEDWANKTPFPAALRAAANAGADVDDQAARRVDEALQEALGFSDESLTQWTSSDAEDMAQAIRAAAAPAALSESDHEVLLALALGQESAETLEIAASDASEAPALRELERSVRAAALGGELNELGLRRAISSAFAGHREQSQSAMPWRRLSALAVAAAFFLLVAVGGQAWLGSERTPEAVSAGTPPSATAMALTPVRSTAPLVQTSTPFALRGGESARLGLIVRTRAADLRRNRFAAWGLR